VDASNKNVEGEVDRIAHKQLNRKTALFESEKELDRDQTRALEFIKAKDKEEKGLEEERKRLAALRAEKDEKLRNIDMELQNYQANINKNLDTLHVYGQSRKFVLSLLTQEERDEIENERKVAEEDLRRRWIMEGRKHKDMDFILFKDNYIIGEERAALLRESLSKNMLPALP
jgi:hypothetical protein